MVIGTGPAGAVIAKTLTDIKKTSVLVLEAGDNNDKDEPIRDSVSTLDVIDDDLKLEKFIQDNFDHNHHQQSFLRMAPLNKGGVVDRLGKVHGVKDLIVADASIIPFTVDGNTSAAAFLIGYTIARQLRKKAPRLRSMESEEE
ncbi:GMC oxidoreductase [Paenibacillus apiarius]|nr:GMC oxidoreductase [Paenibacillus apiarius]MEC0119328.1 GMC oxidoreductase [Paenibacillus apiarius]MEC0191064.1 GMC oxidoreductase [Paenibacillus apiarius]